MSLTGFNLRRRLAAQQAAEEEARRVAEQAPKKPKAIDEMTVAELKIYAAEKGIALGGATKKADILAAIKGAEEPSAGGGNDGGQGQDPKGDPGRDGGANENAVTADQGTADDKREADVNAANEDAEQGVPGNGGDGDE